MFGILDGIPPTPNVFADPVRELKRPGFLADPGAFVGRGKFLRLRPRLVPRRVCGIRE